SVSDKGLVVRGIGIRLLYRIDVYLSVYQFIADVLGMTRNVLDEKNPEALNLLGFLNFFGILWKY
ncbi:hypothetical protein ACEUAK_21445, partial [Aeromonas veronii]